MAYYVYDKPVGDTQTYVGRENLHRSLLQGVLQGRSFAVCGSAKTGRTSALLNLADQLIDRWHRVPRVTKIVPVYVPLGQTRVNPVGHFVAAFWDNLTNALRDPRLFGNSAPPELPRVLLGHSKQPWEHFKNALADLFSWCRYVLLLDDVDPFFFPPIDEYLSGVLTTFKELRENAPLAVVCTGGRMLRDQLLDRYSYVAGLRPLSLGSLTEPAAVALIRQGFRDLSDDDMAFLLNQSGRHPYVLQRVLAELENQPEPHVQEALESTFADLQTLFENLWEQFDLGRGVTYRGIYAAPEHAVMQFLIDQQSPVDLRTIERELGLKPLREYVDFFEYAGVGEQVVLKDKNLYRAHFTLWNSWYADRILK